MTDISGAERLALIAQAQIDLVNEQAEFVETALEARARQRGDVLVIDWSSGQRATYSDNVIPFPLQRRLNR